MRISDTSKRDDQAPLDQDERVDWLRQVSEITLEWQLDNRLGVFHHCVEDERSDLESQYGLNVQHTLHRRACPRSLTSTFSLHDQGGCESVHA